MGNFFKRLKAGGKKINMETGFTIHNKQRVSFVQVKKACKLSYDGDKGSGQEQTLGERHPFVNVVRNLETAKNRTSCARRKKIWEN